MTDVEAGKLKNDDPREKLDLGEAISYFANEDRWISKLTVLLSVGAITLFGTTVPALLALIPFAPPELIDVAQGTPYEPIFERLAGAEASVVLMIPAFLLGLVCGALQLGYYIEIVRRVRARAEVKLPPWERWGHLLGNGAKMMLAYAVYIISIFLFLAICLWLVTGLEDLNQGVFVLVALTCCVLPFMLAYVIFVVFMTSICVIPYSESGDLRDFFEISWVLDNIRRDGNLTINWFALGVAANLGFQAVQSIPLVGILGFFFSLALQGPVQGHLLGQYAEILDAREANRRRVEDT